MAESWATQIIDSLTELIAQHDRWLDAVAAHRAAMVQADARALQRAAEDQQQIMAAIAAIEQDRQSIVQRIVNATPELRTRDQAGAPPPTITELAALASAAHRATLLELGDALTDRIERIRKAQSALRLAAQSLAAHMEGLVQRVARVLSSAATYSSRGEVAPARPVALGLDLTS